MINKFDINMFEIQSSLGEMDDHFDICCIFEISKFDKFDIARLTCTFNAPLLFACNSDQIRFSHNETNILISVSGGKTCCDSCPDNLASPQPIRTQASSS